MCHEQLFHKESCSLTLTYDDDHLPAFGQLVKKDLQKFFDRLRYFYGPFRYVACGEYGEEKRRPHFHVALYGMDFMSDRLFYGYGKRGDPIYTSSRLARAWTAGRATIGSLTFESAAYIARYITKKIQGPGASPLPLACDPDTGELVMPNPEFLLMSRGRGKGNGIGGEWFRKFFATDAQPHGRVITAQGTPAPIPRYYKRLLDETDVHHFRNLGNPLNAKKAALMVKMNENFRRNAQHFDFENQPHRKAARDIVAKASTNLFKRNVE